MSQQNPQNNKNDDAINSFDPKQIANILDVEKQILDKENTIIAKESYIAKRSGFMGKIIMAVGFLTILSISLTGALISQNIDNKNSQASVTYSCLDSETLSGNNCISNTNSYPVYGEGCSASYITMQSVCAKVTPQACTNFAEAVDAETGFCKIGDVDNVLLSEVTDVDGRTCNGNGYNFKRYNVGFATNSTQGPLICASAFSGVFGKANFRFTPQIVTDIQNFTTSQTGSQIIQCLAGYTSINNNSQCSRPATVLGCNAGGEYLGRLNLFGDIKASAQTPVANANVSCKPCPAGQYCPNNSTGATTIKICANGGSLSGDKCIAPNKVTQTTYTDGCASEYVRLDQSCAIIEVRTHDLGCTYYYASDNVNVLAVLSEDGVRCSTGGRTDFENTSIVKASDFQCDGPDSAYYNYNVAYDPLVCGKGNPVNKAAFRWSQNSFTKITGLQKLGKNTSVCPATWISLSDTECYQLVSTQEYKAKNDCPVNTYCPEGSLTPTPCPANSTSPAKSSKLSDCVATVVVNTAVTPAAPVVNSGGTVITINTTIPAVSSSSSSQAVQVTQVAVCLSKPGEYFTSGNCVPCVAGYYCPGGYSAPIICPIAYYCPAASANPTPCPVGTTTLGLGSRVLDDCKAIAKQAVTVVRTGGLQVFIAIFSTLSLFFFGYIYLSSKSAKGGLDKGWSKAR
jgi:hypothetical protein